MIGYKDNQMVYSKSSNNWFETFPSWVTKKDKSGAMGWIPKHYQFRNRGESKRLGEVQYKLHGPSTMQISGYPPDVQQ